MGGVASGNFSGDVDFSSTTDNTLGNPDTGAVQFNGGIGRPDSWWWTPRSNQSTFVGVANFQGGTINLGDGDTDNVSFGGEIVSNIVPNDDGLYDLGTETKQWKDIYLSGAVNSNSVVTNSLTLSGAEITSITDEDDMVSDSDAAVPTQQSVKAYVDAQLTAQVLSFKADEGGTQAVDLDSQQLSIVGTQNQKLLLVNLSYKFIKLLTLIPQLLYLQCDRQYLHSTSGNTAISIDTLGDVTLIEI